MKVLTKALERVHECALRSARLSESELERWAWLHRANTLREALPAQLEVAEKNRRVGCDRYNYRGYGVGCVATAELENWHEIVIERAIYPFACFQAQGWNSMNRDRSHRICAENMALQDAALKGAAYIPMLVIRAKPQDDHIGSVESPCVATCVNMLDQSILVDESTIVLRARHDLSLVRVDRWGSLYRSIAFNEGIVLGEIA